MYVLQFTRKQGCARAQERENNCFETTTKTTNKNYNNNLKQENKPAIALTTRKEKRRDVVMKERMS